MADDDDNIERKALLEFPCRFPIKMMGRDEPAFHKAARSIVSQHVGDIADDAIRLAASRKRNFVSITVTIEAVSQQQLDDIYRDLTAHPQILVAL